MKYLFMLFIIQVDLDVRSPHSRTSSPNDARFYTLTEDVICPKVFNTYVPD